MYVYICIYREILDSIMAPKYDHFLIPGICEHVTLHGKKDFVDV